MQRSDLTADFPRYCNEAIREICLKRSWRCMKTRAQVTMSANTSSATLPSDFKELVNERSPIEHVSSDGLAIPSDVYRREKLVRWDAWLLNGQVVYSNTTTGRVALQVYIDDLDGEPVLRTLRPLSTATVFNVNYYRFLPDLAEDEDENDLTVKYPAMCREKSKALAFADINDELAAAHEELFQVKFKEASAQDSYSAVAGTVFRMGG